MPCIKGAVKYLICNYNNVIILITLHLIFISHECRCPSNPLEAINCGIYLSMFMHHFFEVSVHSVRGYQQAAVQYFEILFDM